MPGGLGVMKLRATDQTLGPFAPVACTRQYTVAFTGRPLVRAYVEAVVLTVLSSGLKAGFVASCSVYPLAPPTSPQSNVTWNSSRLLPSDGRPGAGGRMAVRNG